MRVRTPQWASKVICITQTKNIKLIKEIIKAYEKRQKEIVLFIHSKYADDWHFSYPYSAMLKSIVLMRLKKLRFVTKLVNYLTKHPNEALRLGFYKDENNKLLLPDRRTFGYFVKHRLDERIDQILDKIVFEVENYAVEIGARLDIISSNQSYRNISERTIKRKKAEKLRKVCRFIRRKIYPHIELQLHHNTIYKKNDFLDMLIHIAMTKDFTENGSRTFNLINNGKRTPNADTLLYHIKKLKSEEEQLRVLTKIFDRTFSIAKTTGMFNRMVDVAIDFTDILYYGDKNDSMVLERKPERGTSHCYRFATINVVNAGKRYTLFALPVKKFDKKHEIVEQLLTYTLKKVRIDTVYLDRGFFSVKVMKTLNKLGVDFLMPAIRNARIKEAIRHYDAPHVMEYAMLSKDDYVKFKLAIVEDREGKKRVFASNFGLLRDDNAQNLFRLYSQRWGIETSYRMKNSFRAKTTSKNYTVRLFYFVFSALLYNLWVIINAVVSKSLFTRIKEVPIITAKFFGTVLYTFVDPGGT